MTSSSRTKEEFYVRRAFGDGAPAFADATRYVRPTTPYPLGEAKDLKATCGVRVDDAVVAFSLREYTPGQAEREVQQVERSVGGVVVTRQNVVRIRMPRKTLRDLSRTARGLDAVLGADDVVTELGGELYLSRLVRTDGEGELRPVGRLIATPRGYVRSDLGRSHATDDEFQPGTADVRLRVFLRSPVRGRVIAYGFIGRLGHRPDTVETVTRATALALNALVGLAAFRLLCDLDRVDVPPPPPSRDAVRQRGSVDPITFEVPVLLFTDDGTSAAWGRVPGEIDMERLDPVTGELAFRVRAGHRLAWNPAVEDAVCFEGYRRTLVEAVGRMVEARLGAAAMRDLAYDVLLGDLGGTSVATLRAATADLAGLAATPSGLEPWSAPSAVQRIA